MYSQDVQALINNIRDTAVSSDLECWEQVKYHSDAEILDFIVGMVDFDDLVEKMEVHLQGIDDAINGK